MTPLSNTHIEPSGPPVVLDSKQPEREPRRGQGWSYRLFALFGIPIRIHFTFLLLLAWILVSHLMQGHGLGQSVIDVAMVVAVFACVVLHELSHALTARRFGIRTREITLLPIGGVARLERVPDKPLHELAVAIAGPIASCLIGAGLYVLHLASGGSASLPEVRLEGGGPILMQLAWINLMLAAFNVLPAFPMDGGRVLRAALALLMEHTRATVLAAAIGQAFALALGIIGLLWNPMLAVIGVFIWFGARNEASMVQLKAALRNLPVRHAMITRFDVLSPDDSVKEAALLTLRGLQRHFPVVEDGRVVGLLTHAALIGSLSRGAAPGHVRDIMDRQFETASETEMLDMAFERLQQCQCRALIVMRGNEPVGLLTPENIGELLTMGSV